MIRELPPDETHRAAGALLELRPHLGDVEAVTAAAQEQRAESYRVVAAFGDDAPDHDDAAAAAGFRIITMLAWGRCLDVDDLSCRAAHRRRGHARALMDWLVATARAEGCDALHLDSGHGEERADAHRLYLNSGLRISSHHFSRRLGLRGVDGT